MTYLITGTVFFTMLFFMIAVIMKIFSKELLVQTRLGNVKKIKLTEIIDDELSKPLSERIIRPVLLKLGDVVGKFLPQEKKVQWHKALILAGNPLNLTANEFFVIRLITIFIFPLSCLFVLIDSGTALSQKILIYTVMVTIAYFLPEQYLKAKWNGRRRAVIKNLPDTLDLLTVSVEAGLGFDAALLKVIEKSDNILANEFKKVISETQMGKTRREALKDMADRLNVEELNAFVNSLIQADTLGISISKVLRIQSQQMRQKKRQMIEEQAMKAPVKMLIPMVLFIFPTIFLVLLGPAVLQIMEIF